MAQGEDQDKSAKTEEPSEKKLKDAASQGQVINSSEVTSFIMLLLLSIISIRLIPYILEALCKKLRFFVENAASLPLKEEVFSISIIELMKKSLIYASPIFLVAIVSPVISSYILQGKFIFSSIPMTPKLSNISISSGISRIFSTKNFIEFIKAIFKITIIGIFLYMVIFTDIKGIIQYQDLSTSALIKRLAIIIFDILILMTLIMAVIASIDYSYLKYEYRNQLKMTKQEVKDEYKQTEGSPEIKQKIKKLREDKFAQNIRQIVPKAIVIISDPQNFYSVALKYDSKRTDEVPYCLIKGQNLTAQKINQIAKEYNIVVINNAYLAEELYKNVKTNENIPAKYFEEVAKIISYVLLLKDKK